MRRLVAATLLLAAVGCGHSGDLNDAASDAMLDVESDADASDAPTDGPCTLVSEWSGTLAESNTWRLGGETRGACGATLEVSIDGELVPRPDDSPDWQSVDGNTFDFVGNLWCWEREHGSALGPHELRVARADTEIGTWVGEVRFSGADVTSALPWSLGEAPVRGSEPGNGSSNAIVHEFDVAVEIEGADRIYPFIVEVPPGYDPANPSPALFSFTGWGSADAFRTFSEEAEWGSLLADAGLLHVIPQGRFFDSSRADLDDCPACEGAYGCFDNQCDLGANWWMPVFRAIAEEVVSLYTVDPARVYASGFSCGGAFAFCLGVHYPGKFAAVVVADGNPMVVGSPPVRLDMPRKPVFYVVEAASGPAWTNALGPESIASRGWCLDSTLRTPGTSHQWYPELNEEIVAFLVSSVVQ